MNHIILLNSTRHMVMHRHLLEVARMGLYKIPASVIEFGKLADVANFNP